MKRYFITATGTDIGKTLVTAAIAYQLRQRGLRVAALKPVASGFDAHHPEASDAAHLLAAQELSLERIDEICPWRFAPPVAPDLAAEIENRTLNFTELLEFCHAPRQVDATLIEGVGGIMSPITREHTMLDWMRHYNAPIILVTGSYVGSISHTLTALEVLKYHQLTLDRIIISESANSPISPDQTKEALQRFMPDKTPIYLIPRLDSRTEIWKYAPNLIEAIA